MIGPRFSSCAALQIPILSRRATGPLAMVSPTNTDPGLTRRTPYSTRDPELPLLGRSAELRACRGVRRRRRGRGRNCREAAGSAAGRRTREPRADRIPRGTGRASAAASPRPLAASASSRPSSSGASKGATRRSRGEPRPRGPSSSSSPGITQIQRQASDGRPSPSNSATDVVFAAGDQFLAAPYSRKRSVPSVKDFASPATASRSRHLLRPRDASCALSARQRGRFCGGGGGERRQRRCSSTQSRARTAPAPRLSRSCSTRG